MYKLFIGDDTFGDFARHFYFVPQSDLDLSGCVCNFTLHGVTKSFTDLVSGQRKEVVFSRVETKGFPVGIALATLEAFDSQGRKRTISNSIRVLCSNVVDDVYGENNEIGFKIGAGVDWSLIDNIPPLVKKVNGQSPNSSGEVIINAITTWADIRRKPFLGQSFSLRTDDNVVSAVSRIIEALGGSVNA